MAPGTEPAESCATRAVFFCPQGLQATSSKPANVGEADTFSVSNLFEVMRMEAGTCHRSSESF